MNNAAQPEFSDYTPSQKLCVLDDIAQSIYGNVVMVPLADGKPNFQAKFDDILSVPLVDNDLEDPADAERLCILTGGFHRFTSYPADREIKLISYIADAKGGLEHVQVAGDKSGFERALAALRRGLDGNDMWIAPYSSQDTAPMPDLPIVQPPANDNKPITKPADTTKLEPLPVINPAEWHGVPIPERKWLILGLIPSRTVTLLSGDGGTGKTLLALQIGMATALDCPAWGDVKPTPGRCLYIGAEDEADEFHRRMAAILEGFGCSFTDLDDFRLVPLAERDALLMVENRGKMVQTPLLQQVIDEITAFLPSLIVLDTSVDLFGGDEIKRAHVKQFVGAFHRLAIQLDCAVLLLSHPSVAGMQTGTGLSGSTAWSAAVRSRLYLTAASEKDADPDARVLTTMKANFAAKGSKIGLRWDRGRFVLDDGTQVNPARAMLDKRADAIFVSLLSKLTGQGQNLSPSKSQSHAPSIMAAHPDAKGVSKKDLAAAQQRLLDQGKIQIVEDGPPSRRYKRLLVADEIFGPDRRPLN